MQKNCSLLVYPAPSTPIRTTNKNGSTSVTTEIKGKQTDFTVEWQMPPPLSLLEGSSPVKGPPPRRRPLCHSPRYKRLSSKDLRANLWELRCLADSQLFFSYQKEHPKAAGDCMSYTSWSLPVAHSYSFSTPDTSFSVTESLCNLAQAWETNHAFLFNINISKMHTTLYSF